MGLLFVLAAFHAGATEGQLPLSLFVRVAQSSDAVSTNAASRALDGTNGTFSLTADAPGSWWTAELGRPYQLTRIEVANRSAPGDVAMTGLTLRLLNMDDQVVFQTILTNPGSAATNIVSLPAGLQARSLWIGLPGTQTNGAGNYRVGLAEVRAFGVLNMPFGPEPVVAASNQVRVWQSSEFPGYPAGNAVDGSTFDFTHTDNLPNSYWMADLGRVVPLDRVEIVNRLDCCNARLANLILRVFDGSSNTVSMATLTDVGLGGTYTLTMTSGTLARWIRVGLENGQTNGGGNYYVTLAEAPAYSSGTTNVLTLASSTPVPVTNNLASFKTAYMLRLSATLAGATNANDDNYSTEAKTTTQTVDGYWETDLGATYALYGVRSIAASGISYKLTNTTCRLFDEGHNSVFAKKVAGSPDTFDTDLNGPVFARYVRVGLVDKQRTDPSGGLEWYIGFREVEVFGRLTNTVGIFSFTASTQQIAAPQPVTLNWSVAELRRVEIHPALGSVGAFTASTGLGSLTLTPSNSTEYLLLGSNAAGFFSRAVGVEAGGVPLTVRLSEFVADNQYSLQDGYGNASDWIELRNMGNSPVNLTGWGLSDDLANPMKWVFPTTNLAAHSTLVVFASGENTPFDPAGNLHASFKLNKDGGTLVLTAPDGTNIVDIVPAYPALDIDLAYGRDLEGNWTFMEPTPGAVNTGATYQGWLKSLDWSHARGFYQTGFTLTLTNNSPGSTVFYSLDGTAPSLAYGGGLAITGTKTVRAQAQRAGYKSARVQTKTFIFLGDVIASPLMQTSVTQNTNYAPRLKPGLLALPTISLVAPTTLSYEEQEGSIEVIWPDGSPAVQENCGVYDYGGSWYAYPKRSFVVAFRSRYGASKLQVPLFNGFDHGVLAKTSFDKLDLNAGNQDMYDRGFYMSDRFVQDSMLDMGALNPHGRFVHVYLNGVYWGQYNCKEVLMENFLADYLGGTPDDYVSVKGNDNLGDEFVLGAPDPPNVAPWERAVALKGSYNSVKAYLDVTHLIDFMVLWNYGNCESEFRACGPKNAGTGFKFWMNDPDGFLRTGAGNRTVRNGPGGLFGGLVAENDSDFKTLLADRIYKHFFNNGALTPTQNDARLAARMQEINDSLLAECARWGYQTPSSWVTAANTIRSSLFPSRTSELLGYLRSANYYPSFDPPTFNQYGGVVASGFQPQLSSSAGTIYYTLDGSDPRLAGGAISSSARVWTAGAVTITGNQILTVRVLNGSGQWSALAQPHFVIAAPRAPGLRDLLVTEICYNPAGSDDYEFIELYNASANPLDLSGVSLSNAVRFIFPNGSTLASGAFVLVAKSTSSFAERYQTPSSLYYWPGLTVAGQWSGSLNNAGETLSLVASNGVELSSVSYQPNGVWPDRADGQGSSLELSALPSATASDAEVRAFLTDGLNWSASSLYHGSPGRFDSFVRAVRINELLSHSLVTEDWIELFNTSTQAVALANCTLTDDLNQPSRYAFSNGTVLLPGQFLLLTASQLGFAFSELGESAALVQMSGTNVVRFLDVVDFPAAAPEEPFGHYQRLDGEHDFTELSASTPGAANALPRIGPLVISEIMFAPAAGKSAFIELTSLTNAPLDLFDPAHPTNVWTLAGVGNFAFPTGTVLAPLASLIVCATTPDAFRAQYSVSAAMPVFGPWPGTLDTNGETLKLLRPGGPRTNEVPYYRVDHVTFRTVSPWPINVVGTSLQRIPVESYGNDPLDWTAAAPTPSTNLAPAAKPVIVVSPQSLYVDEGMTVSFSVIATGAPPLSYQWRFVGVSIVGATNATIVLTNVQVSQAGAYDVLVLGPGGSAMSAAATLFVSKPPVITAQPTNQVMRPASNAVFSVTATGHSLLRYQWRLNGIALSGATNATLLLTNVVRENAGTYTVLVSDDLGSALSMPATLSLLIDPVIVQQPLSQPVLAGANATLSVVVTNTATLPINYRWRRSGFTFTNLYLNSCTSFFTITNTQAPYTNWSVFVTNVAKPAGVLSSNAYLTILANTNANGLPDVWEAAHGFGPGNPALPRADPDGDGLSNWQEYIAGTDPTNAASCLKLEASSNCGLAALTQQAVSNRTYSIFYTDGLEPSAWVKLADLPARATNWTAVIPDPNAHTNRFYRVVVPMQP